MFGERVDGAGGASGATAGAGEQAGGQTQPEGGQNSGQQAKSPETFDAWLAGQPVEIKTLMDGRIGGLKTALQSERERNKTLEKNLRDAASKAEKGSDNEKRLVELANQVAEASRKAAFYEGAAAAGVTNSKLALIAAVNDDLFKKDGSPDFEALRKSYPELFGRPASNNAGSGGEGGQGAGGKQSMDAYIRSRVNGGSK